MKIKILIIAILAIASLKSIAQDIEYTYDAAGNRTSRKVIPSPPAPAVYNDSTLFNLDNAKSEPEVYEEVLAEKQIRIYPNPTRGKLSIEIVNYNFNDNGSIQVFDMTGRLVQNISSLSQRMEVDITNDPAGSYILILLIGQDKSEWKIIKQ